MRTAHRWSSGLKLIGLGAAAGLAWTLVRERRRISLQDRVVLILGGSRGLGLVLARQFAGQGARIVLAARDSGALHRARAELVSRGAQAHVVVADLRKADDVRHAVHETLKHFGRIDILVNNAGVIQVGPLEHMGVDDFEAELRIHLFAPLHAMLAVIPHMRRQGGGRIVNIASIGGKLAFPHMAPYSTSKFALVGLSDAIRNEVRKDNIYVTTVCPGLMRTGSAGNAFFKGRHRQEHTWFAISASLPLLSVSAERAAARIVSACRHGSPSLVIGLPARAGVLLGGVAPGLMGEILALVNRLLPGAMQNRLLEQRSGWQSTTRLAPSILTRLSDRAAMANNEVSV